MFLPDSMFFTFRGDGFSRSVTLRKETADVGSEVRSGLMTGTGTVGFAGLFSPKVKKPRPE